MNKNDYLDVVVIVIIVIYSYKHYKNSDPKNVYSSLKNYKL